MDDIVDELPADHNLKCHVCGEYKFEEREGFYYCQECGTKQEQVRRIEIEQHDEFDEKKLKAKKLKIHAAKAEKPQLTSWECYNYILRGFVEELLSYGAKEELKLMALQVWAAYLRRMEVAFFNRKQADLPKLGIKYLHNDAATLFNHSKQVRERRKRRRRDDTSCTSATSGSKSSRTYRRSKNKLDQSNYSLTSATSGGTEYTSSTSAYSNKAIKIGFSAKARSYFKRKMPVKHLAKHAADAEGVLKCHKQPTSRQIKRSDYNLMLVNIKQIYSILAIALNLIGDEIQLSDLERFVREGHIGTSNVLKYFPENIANNGKEILKKIQFYYNSQNYSDKVLRDHIGTLCKNIGITVRKPNIINLVRRYITELCLPTDFANYIERLINLLPPQFDTRVAGYYPRFEARAMAYIIFTLKLLYGLDDNKEYRISRTSQILNSKISQLNREKQEKQPLLFDWNEWVQYIEMRKIIVSQYNTSFCEQFKQYQSTNQILEQMAKEMSNAKENDNLYNDSSENLLMKQNVENFRLILERFQENKKFSENDIQKPLKIDFKPSFTPAHSYFKTIMLLCDNESHKIKVPEFMRVDHSQRDINSFLQVKPLISYFKSHAVKLNIHVLATNKNKRYVGIFDAPRNYNRINHNFYRACFEITDEEWSEMVMGTTREGTDNLEFITDLETYKTKSYYEKKKLNKKRQMCFNPHMNYDINMIRDDDTSGGDLKTPQRKLPQNNLAQKSEDLQSMHSCDIFSENNMEPIDNADFITKPRRNLENIDLFEGISDEESVLNDDDFDDDHHNDVEPIISNGCNSISPSQELQTSFLSIPSSPPPDLEEFIKIERVTPTKTKDDKSSKRNETTKMYISNMDCWIMLGSIFMLTNAQKTQLQDKFPRSFQWLLETCAQTINVEWIQVFEQLLCIETMFCFGINDPKTIKNFVYMNSNNPIKKIQMILKTYQEIW